MVSQPATDGLVDVVRDDEPDEGDVLQLSGTRCVEVGVVVGAPVSELDPQQRQFLAFALAYDDVPGTKVAYPKARAS